MLVSVWREKESVWNRGGKHDTPNAMQPVVDLSTVSEDHLLFSPKFENPRS
jgi:hypothetical protein